MTTATTEAPTVPIKRAQLNLTAPVDALRDALTWVGQVLPIAKRSQKQTHLGIRIDVSRGVTTLVAGNFYEYATATVSSPGGRGSVLVPGRLFTDAIRSLPRGSSIVMTADRDRLQILGGNLDGPVTFDIPLMDLGDYPSTPDTPVEVLHLTGLQLEELARPCVAAGRDDTLPVLMAVKVHNDAGVLTAASTDRYRLAVNTLPDVAAPDGLDVLVPAGTLAAAAKAFRKDRHITVRRSDDWLTFDNGSRTLTAQLIHGEYPKYQALLAPYLQPGAGKALADRAPLRAAIAAASVVLARLSPLVLDARGENLVLTAGARDTSEPGATAVVSGSSHADLATAEIALNPRYLTEGINAVRDDKLQITIREEQKPVVITGRDGDTFLYLLMPVRRWQPT